MFRCFGQHDFILDERGYECKRCGIREEIIHGQKFVLDPRAPKTEIQLIDGSGKVVGRLVNVKS